MEISHSPVLKKKRGRPKGVQNSIIKMPSSQVRSPLQLRSHTRSGQLSSVDNAMYNGKHEFFNVNIKSSQYSNIIY